MTIEALKRLCQPLYAFVYTYFEKPDFENPDFWTYNFSLTPVEVCEAVYTAEKCIRELESLLYNEDDVMLLWAHKELLLNTLVVCTQLPFIAELLFQAEKADAAVALRDKLIDEFTSKVVEDPNVIKAIQEGTIDVEIQKRQKELFNFRPLFETNRSYVVNPTGITFQEIPETF